MKLQIIIIILLSLFLIYNIAILYKIFKYISDEPDYSLCENTKKYNIALLDNNLNNINTGDIILFSTYSYFPLMRIFGDKVFSHIGMVVELDNKYYILEMTVFDIMNNKKYTNKSLFSLYDRINTYAGNIFISKLQKPLNANQLDKLYNLINQDNKFLNSIELYINMLYNKNFSNKFTCSSYIFYILQNLNIIDCKIKIKNIDIHSFLIDLCHNSNIYAEPVELLCNSSNITKLDNKTIDYPNI